MRRNKKGELTSAQLITIIIIIVSFLILLFFLFKLNVGETSLKETCYNSVVLSDKGAGLVSSLDCSTNYVCVSGGGSCTDFTLTANSNVDVSKPADAKAAVIKSLADEMTDCWWEFGAGKINYGGSSLSGNKICALCSIAKFDSKVQKEVPAISYSELYSYLKTHQSSRDTSQSYLHYLYATNNLDVLQEFYIQNYMSKSIDTSKEYFILTGRSKSAVWNLFGSDHIPVTILEKTAENYNSVGCDEFITKS